MGLATVATGVCLGLNSSRPLGSTGEGVSPPHGWSGQEERRRFTVPPPTQFAVQVKLAASFACACVGFAGPVYFG